MSFKIPKNTLALVLIGVLPGIMSGADAAKPSGADKSGTAVKTGAGKPKSDKPKENSRVKTEQAIFAAGCFWKVQYVFGELPGVIRCRAGYTGGHTKDPNYKEVCGHGTGHAEAVLVDFDPTKITYRHLLEKFFSMHDPTTLNRQGPDVGDQYRSAIFCTTPEQLKEAQAYKKEMEDARRFKSPIVTKIESSSQFYDAEDYHQDYFKKHGAVCH